MVSIHIEGWKGGKPAYLEVREFNLDSYDLLGVKVVFHPAAGISRPPVLTGLPESVEVRTGDTLKLSAQASDPDGALAFHAWTFSDWDNPDGDTVDVTGALIDSSASLSAAHVYSIPGNYLAILTVSDSMSTVKDSVKVSVKARDGSQPLEADAGTDMTVATDSIITLTGKVKAGSGTVTGYAWKFGGEGFSTASLPGDTSATMPRQPGRFTVVLKATDDSGQSDIDTAVFTVVASGNAQLAALRLGGTGLDPAFKSVTEFYTASVPFETICLKLGAITQHRAAKVKVGALDLGAADSAEVDLAVGENVVEVVVLSQSGVQKKYQVAVTRRRTRRPASIPWRFPLASSRHIPSGHGGVHGRGGERHRFVGIYGSSTG